MQMDALQAVYTKTTRCPYMYNTMSMRGLHGAYGGNDTHAMHVGSHVYVQLYLLVQVHNCSI